MDKIKPDARQRQRRPQAGQQRQNEDDVYAKGHIRQKSRQAVVRQHVQDNEHEADNTRPQAALPPILSPNGTHVAQAFDFKGYRQRTPCFS